MSIPRQPSTNHAPSGAHSVLCLLSSVLCSLLLFACTAAPVRENTGLPLEETAWRLTRLAGNDIPRSDAPAHLRLQAGRFTGSGGCNRILGKYEQEGARLRFSAPAGTLMACMGETGQRETSFLERLLEVRSWTIADKTLRLGDAKGEIILEMEADSPAPSAP
jgi:heat shock protein HslJ